MIFDSHAHYDDDAFKEDREELLQGMEAAGVKAIVNVSATFESIETTFDLTQKYPFIYGTVGVHPDEIGVLDEEKFQYLREQSKREKIVAIGEIGLDYYWDKEGHELQKEWFLRQLRLAKELKKPVIIHSREACADTLELMKQEHSEELSAVIHCFSYPVEIAREYLSMGYYLGIGGVLTFKNAKKLKEVVAEAPIERLLLETDAPYLSPVPYRGKRNDSRNLSYVAEEIAKIKGLSVEEVFQITYKNAMKFYGLEQEK